MTMDMVARDIDRQCKGQLREDLMLAVNITPEKELTPYCALILCLNYAVASFRQSFRKRFIQFILLGMAAAAYSVQFHTYTHLFYFDGIRHLGQSAVFWGAMIHLFLLVLLTSSVCGVPLFVWLQRRKRGRI